MSDSRPPAAWSAPSVAIVAFGLVFAFTAANAIFNALAVTLGASPPYTTFLPGPADLFADFFKFVLSYPGGALVPVGDAAALQDLLAGYVAQNPYHGVEGLGRGVVTHLHVTPFTTLLSLAALGAMRFLDPIWLFGILVAALVAWAVVLVSGTSRSRREAVIWSGFLLISYPALLVFTRGNLFAGLAALLMVQAAILVARDRDGSLAALLLAFAINVRPNAAIFALVLLAAAPGTRLRAGAVLALATAFLFGVSLAWDGQIYPDYTLQTFLAGLGQYYQVYVLGHLGLPYGSSLYGAAKLLLQGHGPGLDTAAALAALSLAAVAVALRIKSAMTVSVFVFLISAAYCLGSTVFADYHLLVFAAPVLCLAIQPDREGGTGSATCGPDAWIVLAVSCAMLAPKNYVFWGQISAQVLINPLLLAGAAGAIVLRHARAPSNFRRGQAPLVN